MSVLASLGLALGHAAAAPAVNIDFDLTFIGQMVIFAALIVVMKPLLLDPVLGLFEEREKRTDGAKAAARVMQLARLPPLVLAGLIVALLLSAPCPASAEPQEAETATPAHGEGEHDEESSEINWVYGFLGEKEGVEPSVAYRPKGMPPPFLA